MMKETSGGNMRLIDADMLIERVEGKCRDYARGKNMSVTAALSDIAFLGRIIKEVGLSQTVDAAPCDPRKMDAYRLRTRGDDLLKLWVYVLRRTRL